MVALKASDCVPAGMTPGHQAIKGSRIPPSHVEPLYPLSGPLLRPRPAVAPLSEVKITKVDR